MAPTTPRMSHAMHRLAFVVVAATLLAALPPATAQQAPALELTLLEADAVATTGYRALFVAEIRNTADRNVTVTLIANESTGTLPLEMERGSILTLAPFEAVRVNISVTPNETVPYGDYALRLDAAEMFGMGAQRPSVAWGVRVAPPPNWRILVNDTPHPAPAGGTAFIDVDVRNDGADTVSLRLDAHDGRGALQPHFEEPYVTLGAGEVRVVTLEVPIPQDSGGGWHPITVSATRTDADPRTLRVSTLVTVGPRFMMPPGPEPRPIMFQQPMHLNVTVSALDAELVVQPLAPARARFVVENVDDNDVSGRLNYRVAEADGRIGIMVSSLSTLQIPPRGALEQEIAFTLPADTPAGNYTAQFTFWETVNGTTEISIPLRVEPRAMLHPPALVVARIEPLPVQVAAGSRAEALLTLQSIAATGPLVVQLRAPDDPRGFRLEFPQPAVRLAPGVEQTLRVLVHAPSDAPAGRGFDLPYRLVIGDGERSQTESVRVRVTEGAPPPPPAMLDAMAGFVQEHPLATGGAIAFAGVAGVALTLGRREWWRYLMVAPLLPLYTRLQKREVLEHKTRERIHQMIVDRPGVHYSALKEETGLNAGALVHHLRTLERHGLVASRREGVLRRFYPTGARLPPPPAVPLTPTQQRIVDMLAAEPMTQREVAARLGLTQQGASYHLKTLERKGLLATERDGGEWRYFRLHELDVTASASG